MNCFFILLLLGLYDFFICFKLAFQPLDSLMDILNWLLLDFDIDLSLLINLTDLFINKL